MKRHLLLLLFLLAFVPHLPASTPNPPAVTATPLLLQQALWVAANDGFLYRLDPDDGKALRQLRVGMPILNKPCADSERIYVSECCGRVMAVSQ